MMYAALAFFLLVNVVVASAQVPGGIEITCDVDRPTFRTVVRNENQVTFRLWDSANGGSQCGPDYVVPVDALVVFKRHTDRVRTADPVALQRRKALRIAAVLGSDASPVQLCSGQEAWLDITIGTTTMTCDFSAQEPQGRRRLYAVSFARENGSSGGVTQVDTGAGLQGGPITSAGAISVSAPTCSGTDKLTWNGSGFQCAPDQTGGGSGTVTSVGSGAGLTGGPITASGSLSVSAPTCASTESLTWNGSVFQCAAPPASDVQCTGCVCGADIGDGCVTGSDVADGTITGADLAPGTITSSNLAPGVGGAWSLVETILLNDSGFTVSSTTLPTDSNLFMVALDNVQLGVFDGTVGFRPNGSTGLSCQSRKIQGNTVSTVSGNYALVACNGAASPPGATTTITETMIVPRLSYTWGAYYEFTNTCHLGGLLTSLLGAGCDTPSAPLTSMTFFIASGSDAGGGHGFLSGRIHIFKLVTG